MEDNGHEGVVGLLRVEATGPSILDSPLIAYREPVPDDENISASDLKPRFYEHLEEFAGSQQVFVIDNTDPPAEYATRGTHFTANEKHGLYGLFPPLKKAIKK